MSTLVSIRVLLAADFRKNYAYYLIILPVIIYYLIFAYVPMYGAVIAFKKFKPSAGILGSPWVGLEHFKSFFTSYYFWTLLRNTLLLSAYDILFSFSAPIILALLLNEVGSKFLKRGIQTITYMPHFISLVVMCGIIIDFSQADGLLGSLYSIATGKSFNLLSRPELFRALFVGTNIWQQVGFGSIIYMAALSSIDPQQYESAVMDGAGRWRQTLSITIPGIAPTIIVLLILRIGSVMNVSFEKVILLYNPLIYDTADVISSFVYRRGIQEASYSYSAAVGLFNSVINCFFLITANWWSRHVNDTSLW